MSVIPKWLVVSFKAITVLFLFFYLPACFVYLVSPAQWWPMGILAIGFPYMWLFLIVLCLCWLFISRRSAVILAMLLAAGLPVMRNVFAMHPNKLFELAKAGGAVRLMQWNCNGLQGHLDYSQELINERYKAVSFIRQYNPAIICIQDFANTEAEHVRKNIALLRDTLGYRYFIYTQHYKTVAWNYHEGIGIAIFSKYPITDSGKLFYPHKKIPESIIWASIRVGNKVVRVVTTHLQSMHLERSVDKRVETDLREDSAVIVSTSILKKLRYFQAYHAGEAIFLRNFLDSCRGPLVFTGDLNSVPSSFVYNKIKGKDLQDGFLENGFGFGKTYHSVQPAIRIDYILHNKAIRCLQSSVFSTTFSDHDPVLMDFIVQ